MSKELVRTKTPITAIGGYTLHPERHNLSFGRWAIPVMARKMQDSDFMERKRAIQALSDFVFDSKRVASKEFASVVPYLKNACEEENVTVRTAAARCLGAIVSTAAGRRAFGQHNLYKEVLSLIVDEEKVIRQATSIVLQRLNLSPIAAEDLVAAGAIPILIDQVSKEDDDVLEILLPAVHACSHIDPDEVLNAKGLDVSTPLLMSKNPRVKERAASIIKELSVNVKGRTKVLELSTLSHLIDLFDDDDELVKAKALSAVMMIVNTTAAKLFLLEKNATEMILPFLKSENVEIRLNAVKILTALGEVPRGKDLIKEHLQIITSLCNDEIIEIQAATKKLIAVITFNP